MCSRGLGFQLQKSSEGRWPRQKRARLVAGKDDNERAAKMSAHKQKGAPATTISIRPILVGLKEQMIGISFFDALDA